MEELTIRILLALSRNLGRAMSIQDLTNEIKRQHGSAYYANTYNAVQPLKKQGLFQLAYLGRASSISLNFESYLLREFLTEMELHKTREILQNNPRAEAVFAELDRGLREAAASFALISDAQRNLRLNRIELLVCVAKGQEARAIRAVQELSRKLTIRIDALCISHEEFRALMSKADHNPIKEAAATGTAFFGPQAYWALIAGAEAEGQRLLSAEPLPLAKLPENDLLFNLGRFGFPLLGAPAGGRPLSIELTATAALMSRDLRLHNGAAVILSKNAFSAGLMAFLATKYGQSGALRSLLRSGSPSKDKERLKALLPKEAGRRSRSSRLKTLETYHAT